MAMNEKLARWAGFRELAAGKWLTPDEVMMWEDWVNL